MRPRSSRCKKRSREQRERTDWKEGGEETKGHGIEKAKENNKMNDSFKMFNCIISFPYPPHPPKKVVSDFQENSLKLK